MSQFVHLHNRSHYSVLSGIPRIEELLNKVASFPEKTIALTDHLNLFGFMEFCNLCKKKEIKGIYGSEFLLTPDSRFEKTTNHFEIVLLAYSLEGFYNLVKLSSLSYEEGFYKVPRIDFRILNRYHKGLIFLTGGLDGIVYKNLMQNDLEKATFFLKDLKNIFSKENLFIEIQDHFTNEEKLYNKSLITLSEELEIPLVATNQALYLEKEDSILLDCVRCIKDKEILKDVTKYSNEYYLKSPNEMEKIFINLPDAIENTKKIASRCDVSLSFGGNYIPTFPIPKDEKDLNTYLKNLCENFLKEKFDDNIPTKYQERLDRELNVIQSMGFSNYFLIVQDYAQYAKQMGILVGPGRGSAAGSLIAYTTGITSVDPIHYDLLFERFLNPERVSMPDIDLDFQFDRRDEVKEYIRFTYGYDKTADVITFGYNKAKSVLKDVGRIFEIPHTLINTITKKIEDKPLKDIIKENKELSKYLNSPEEKERKWIEYSIRLDGRIRNLGAHASALVISDKPLSDIVPLYQEGHGIENLQTQYEGSYLEKNGLIKMDILGLKNLTIIQDCLENIFLNHHIHIDLDNINLNDPNVFKLFTKGLTKGIFQFESPGMTEYLTELKPTSIDDLIAMNALYRPGPMENIPSFIKRKHNLEEINYFHENLKPILENTYGIIVYQEQVMQIAQVLAGFSLGKADLLRRAMAKKKEKELAKLYPDWVNGAIANGYKESLAKHIYDLLIPFSHYAFNKSHSVAYSILAYQTAYLKTYYFKEFIVALLSHNAESIEKIESYLQECHKHNVKVLSPDINASKWEFTIEKDAIRYGFSGIKGIGKEVALTISREREHSGIFHTFNEFIERILNTGIVKKNHIEILIYTGGLDSLIDPTRYLEDKAHILAHLETFIKGQQKKEKEHEQGVLSLFDIETENEATQVERFSPLNPIQDFQKEIEILGFYLSKKLFYHYENSLGILSTFEDNFKHDLKEKINVSIWGYVSFVVRRTTKRGNPFLFMKIQTTNEVFPLYLFQENFEKYHPIIQEGNFLLLQLYLEQNNNHLQYQVSNIQSMNQKIYFTTINILLRESSLDKNAKEFIKTLFQLSQKKTENGNTYKITFYSKKNEEKFLYPTNTKIIFTTQLTHFLKESELVKGFWLT